MSKGLTKKELKRFSKSALIKICGENSVECNRKDLKTDLVNRIFKNKGLRSKLTAPAKRVASAAQMKARAAFADRARARSGKKQPFRPNPPNEVEAEDVDKSVGVDVGLGRVSTIKRKIAKAPSIPAPFGQLRKRKKFKQATQVRPIKNVHAFSAQVNPPKPVAANSVPVPTRNVVDPTASNRQPPPVSFRKPEGVSQSDAAEKTPIMRLPTDINPRSRQLGKKIPIIEQEQHDKLAGRLFTTDYKFSNIIKRRSDKNAKLLFREFHTGPTIAINKRRTHTNELIERIHTNARIMGVRHREFLDGNNKTTDSFDQYLRGGQTKQAQILINQALRKTTRRKEQEFQGGIAELDEDLGISADDPKSEILEILLARQNSVSEGTQAGSPQQASQGTQAIQQALQKREEEQKEERTIQDIKIVVSPEQTNKIFVTAVLNTFSEGSDGVETITNPSSGRQIRVDTPTYKKQFKLLSDTQKKQIEDFLQKKRAGAAVDRPFGL